jgi:DNA polymerase III epsilon subunit-like protein
MSDFNSIRSFDWMILWFTSLKDQFVLDELDKVSWWYRNNALRIPSWTTEKAEKLIWSINPVLNLFYTFKGLKYRELGNNSNTNRIFNLSEEKRNLVFEEKLLSYITDLTKFQWNLNFYNKDFVHNNVEFQERILTKFENTKHITLNEFLYFCNYWFSKTKPPRDHKINFLSGAWAELIKDIKKYDKIVIADFETTCLNEFKDWDILTMSYKMFDKDGGEFRSRSYYVNHYKKDITEWALWAFDYDDYLEKEKISREEFIKWMKSLISPDTLFVFHNWYNFDIEILKSNFLDKWEFIDGMNVLDTIHLFREYFKSINDKNYDVYAYSLDKLSQWFWVENNRDTENHRAEEDVEILSNLFFTLIDENEKEREFF